MITIYNNSIDPEVFINEHINKNSPCVIRNFFSLTDKTFRYFQKGKKNFKKKSVANKTTYLLKKICLNNFMKKVRESVLFFYKGIRGWIHNKGNITQWHYDGNGQHVINICISGSKRFFLAPPSNMEVYPFTNIAIYDKTETDYVDIYKYDLLYIPSHWFHKVITLEDNTFTINYIFYNKIQKKYTTNRDINLYSLHNYFDTHMCNPMNSMICKVTKKSPFYKAFLFGIKEFLPIYLLFFGGLYLLLKKNKQLYVKVNILLTIFILFMITNKKLNNIVSGISKLYGIYLYLGLILFNCIFK